MQEGAQMVRRRHVFQRVCVLVVCGFLVGVLPAVGQQRGSISGKVVDPGGRGLRGRHIPVPKKNAGISRNAISAIGGVYTVVNLAPATYRVVPAPPGFWGAKQANFVLTAGQEITLDLKMSLAGLQ